MRIHLFSTTAALIALAGPTLAEEQVQLAASTVEGVTVLATRTEKSTDEVPAKVTVIDAKQIEDNLVTDIKDLIRFEPGVSVRNSPARFTTALAATGRDGNSGFNIRGLEGNRVLIQTDGVRQPDAYSFGAQTVGRGDYGDLDLLKSVEILRGPASALYGSDGMAGAVSFTTKDPADLIAEGRNVGGQAKLAYSSADDSWAKGVVLAGRADRWSGMIAYTRRDGSEQENQGTNESANTDRTAPNPQDIESNAVLAKVVFDPRDGHRLRATYEYFDREVVSDVLSSIAKPPLAATSTLRIDGLDTTERNRFGLDYRYEADAGAIRHAFVTAYYQDATTRQFTFEDRNTSPDRTRDVTFDNEVLGVSFDLRSEFSLGGLSHRLVYGGDVSKTRQEGIRDGTIPPAGETFPARAFPNTDYTLAGFFVQDEIETMDGRLVLYPALRFDWYELEPKRDALYGAANLAAKQSDERVSPKFGATFKATDTVSFFVTAGAGFKAPAPSQVNNAFSNPLQNYTSIPNPDLKPETSENYEAGVRFKTERFFAEVTAFTGEYKDFISQVQVRGSFTAADPAVYQYVNLGKVEISGIEGRFRANLGKGFGLNAAASYADGESTSNGVKAPLDSIDPVKVVTGLTWRDAQNRFGGQLIATYSAGKKANDIGTVCTGGCFTPPAFALLDATAFWNVTDYATLRAGVFNITDEKYWWWGDARGLANSSIIRDAYTQPGRNASVSLTLRY
ncbi:TonB-dependent hemoglobin/transferrin/lactoferrin family receptor [Caulobacter segnis]|uniref:TonB-dependent hemoglobin/transferrin/lactoferrin family receptor n=1 Tax=Caulobacter segnis TaxID=88688 RepID=UPI00240F2875|nr:TonB-dependent hemoglobin/transferrin/lactoferrin family receptor [Caulobacter segnis]MDG2522700.1 TonB-dependent hemoglobin/transferrin/lactoferrin family receptor [Caulobacter segnis]